MTKLTLNLKDLLIDAFGATAQLPASVDIDDLVDFNDVREHDVDLHELLADERKIALIWSIDDVKARRPDLCDEQAWQVLEKFQQHHDCNAQAIWDTLEQIAHDLFGTGNARRVERCAKALDDYDEDADVDTNLTDLLADAMHWCRDKERDFRHLLEIAEEHFHAETKA
ncbi:MAG TPA: hypothetical protein VGN12_28060 [Pirellulales bacterium]|jgi:hypothetical protein